MSDELRTLVTGAADLAKIKDKSGKDHMLCPLDLSDLVDYEDKTGTSILNLGGADMKLRDIVYMLYLSLRKEGLAYDDIKKKRWTVTERDIYMLFDFGFLKEAAPTILEILRVSGFKMDKKGTPENPPVAPPTT